MSDTQSGSDWSHILGSAMHGKLKGKTLSILPATMTTWQAWREQYPNTTVTLLKPTARQFTRAMLETGEEYCMGLVHDGQSRHWRFDLLAKQSLVNDAIGSLPLLVYFDSPQSSARVWDRRTPHGTLTFSASSAGVVDNETQSIWDLQAGLAVSGKLQGTRLRSTTAIVSFSHAWLRFHPDTTRWEPSE